MPLGNSDEELVSWARVGKVGAFDELVSRHQERVFALAYRILGNAEDAADVQQDTFVRAWTSLGSFRGESTFSTWIHRIAVNICLSRKRKKSYGTSQELNEEVYYENGHQAADCEDATINSVAVRQVLSMMPANHRTLLILRDVEGRSIPEITQVVGGSDGGVRKNLWRARKMFRESARHLFGEDSE